MAAIATSGGGDDEETQQDGEARGKGPGGGFLAERHHAECGQEPDGGGKHGEDGSGGEEGKIGGAFAEGEDGAEVIRREEEGDGGGAGEDGECMESLAAGGTEKSPKEIHEKPANGGEAHLGRDGAIDNGEQEGGGGESSTAPERGARQGAGDVPDGEE